ncbi:MAG: class I SAM-dependent methyltransferase [Bacteroidia bacterium]|nr:class I SAM-dependent methyltransferase [Bacteroidia bacterium]
MYEFHGDKQRYFDMTYAVTKEYILPFLQQHIDLNKPIDVLEIGCGEAGVLKAFTDNGHKAFGIELEESRTELAKQFMATEMAAGKVGFLNKDVYDVDVDTDIGHKFDLVILKDVIEHIPVQEKFIPQLHKFLKPGGKVFFAFPPWYMPYGGHQQVLPGKLASKTPWYHLLPGASYRWMLKAFGVNDSGINTMYEIKSTGITIERFLKINKKAGFELSASEYYLFNPIYKFKFGITPRKQWSIIAKIPFLRNFVTMGVYFLTAPVK